MQPQRSIAVPCPFVCASSCRRGGDGCCLELTGLSNVLYGRVHHQEPLLTPFAGQTGKSGPRRVELLLGFTEIIVVLLYCL